ncbi:fasciclin-2-like isoform X2 [Panonychus citri]|uniref:fasciclin-2-like isoform X2 n=1 Tax=Panonychus citri TaxID=50023 RepID=UPI0023079326|nr:fasciclin-2-like isoform X2 [Panonychus citri]
MRRLLCFSVTLITWLSLINCEIHGKLTIFPDGEKARAEAHKPLLITCSGTNVEPGYFSDFQWFNRNNEQILNNPRIKLSPGQGSLGLIINDPDIGDGGNYRCTAMYQNTKLLNASIEIVIFKSITWDDCPEDQFLILGQPNQKIVCKVSSQPTSKISWEKDFQDLDKSKFSITNDGVIVKGLVSNDTSGSFKITASILEHGVLRTRNIRVQVLVKPIITEFDKYREVVEGERTTFNCRASGTPSPFYSFIDNRRRNLTLENGFTVDTVAGNLVIESVKKDTENQSITCEAKNMAGEVSQKMELRVLTKPVVYQFENLTFAESTRQEWSCKVRGDPIPKITIMKWKSAQDGYDKDPLPKIDSPYTFETIKLGPNEVDYRMKFTSVSRKDDGLYYCRATNKAGNAEVLGHITVEFPPDLSQTNTHVKTWSSNPVNLTCIAEAIPNATISWRFNNIDLRLEKSDSYAFYDGNGISYLTVKPKTANYIFGTYVCVAENLRGKRSIDIKLSEAHPPTSPNVKIIKSRPTSMEFEISDLGSDLPIRNYLVKYWRESEADSEKQKVWPASGKNYRLDDLTPTTRYRFSFASQNDVGIGDYSAYRIETTPDESKPDKPTFLFDVVDETRQLTTDGFVKSDFGDLIHFRWNQAEDNGRAITHYIIKYHQVHKSQDGYLIIGQEYPEIQVNSKDPLQYTLRNLSPNTFYKIELSAVNSIGTSDSNHIIFKTSATASSPSGWGQDLEYDPSTYSMGAALISVAISLIIILIVMDIIFYIRCKVGVLYFIKSFIWPETSVNNHKKADFHPGNLGSISEVKLSSRSEIDNPAFEDITDRINNHHNQQHQQQLPTIRKPKDSAV